MENLNFQHFFSQFSDFEYIGTCIDIESIRKGKEQAQDFVFERHLYNPRRII